MDVMIWLYPLPHLGNTRKTRGRDAVLGVSYYCVWGLWERGMWRCKELFDLKIGDIPREESLLARGWV